MVGGASSGGCSFRFVAEQAPKKLARKLLFLLGVCLANEGYCSPPNDNGKHLLLCSVVIAELTAFDDGKTKVRMGENQRRRRRLERAGTGD